MMATNNKPHPNYLLIANPADCWLRHEHWLGVAYLHLGAMSAGLLVPPSSI